VCANFRRHAPSTAATNSATRILGQVNSAKRVFRFGVEGESFSEAVDNVARLRRAQGRVSPVIQDFFFHKQVNADQIQYQNGKY